MEGPEIFKFEVRHALDMLNRNKATEPGGTVKEITSALDDSVSTRSQK